MLSRLAATMRHFGVMGKYWQAGAVKTRLARHLGADSASQLYRVFLTTLLRRFATMGDTRWLVYTPAAKGPAFRSLALGQWQLTAQSSGDLGARMQAFFDHAFATGARQVVLIGSDSPSLPAAYVEQAFAQLAQHPMVFGPSTDGGFYLIGATRAMPRILDGIPWSTPDVLRQVSARLAQSETSYSLLPNWYDIDEYRHLLQLDRELQESEDLADELRQLANAVHEALLNN